MVSCTSTLAPRRPGPVHDEKPSTHVSAKILHQTMSLGPRRDFTQESVSPVCRKLNTEEKASAHPVIDTGHAEIVQNEIRKGFQPGRRDPWKQTAFANLQSVQYPITLLIECDVFVEIFKK